MRMWRDIAPCNQTATCVVTGRMDLQSLEGRDVSNEQENNEIYWKEGRDVSNEQEIHEIYS